MAEVPENRGSQGSPVPPPFQPVAAVPVGAPAKSGPGALKIVLIVVGIFLFLVLLVVGVVGYIGYRIAHSMHVDKNGTVTMNGPGGLITSNSGVPVSADDLGIEIYPGAEQQKSATMRMNLPTGAVVTAVFRTSDSREKVAEFYKSKLGGQATAMEFGPLSVLTLKKSAHDVISVTITPMGAKTQIQISHTTNKQQ